MTDSHKKALATVPTSEVTAPMSPIVSAGMAILQDNPDPATLRELLAVQREWEAGEALRMFNVALHGLKADLPTAVQKRHPVKDRDGKLMYRHTNLADVMDAAESVMQTHGFTVTWSPSCDANLVHVQCQLRHIGGHVEKTVMSAPPDKGQGRNAVQAIGSTQTYLQRYTLCALLGLAAVDADDADQNKPDPGDVSQAANQRALAWLLRNGWTEAGCVEVAGKPREMWTAEDLAKLRETHRTTGPRAPNEPEIDEATGEVIPPEREPGCDDE